VGHNDLLELFGYDEDLGLTPLTLDTGTKIEIPMEDVQGIIFWIAGKFTSAQTGSLIFKVQFLGCVPGGGAWSRKQSRADMKITWRLPKAWVRQPSVHLILHTHGYTPWHHPRHGSHWLTLQPRGVWTYGTHEYVDDSLVKVCGWRKAMATISAWSSGAREQVFTMGSAVENHMSKEDLGPDASESDWEDLRTL